MTTAIPLLRGRRNPIRRGIKREWWTWRRERCRRDPVITRARDSNSPTPLLWQFRGTGGHFFGSHCTPFSTRILVISLVSCPEFCVDTRGTSPAHPEKIYDDQQDAFHIILSKGWCSGIDGSRFKVLVETFGGGSTHYQATCRGRQFFMYDIKSTYSSWS